MITRLLKSPVGAAGAISVGAFAVYILTLAPTVTFIDSGELAAVACTLGIAHPTGYPLFTLLGWLFSRLPVGAEEIVRLNMMSALFCAGGVLVFSLLTAKVLHIVLAGAAFSTARAREGAGRLVVPASVAAGGMLAFSETYWSAATALEVYSLHVLFLSLLLLLFLSSAYPRATGERGKRNPPPEGLWLLFAFVLGLSFTNHMTTILLAPGLLFLYFASQGGSPRSWKRLARMALPFALGLSVYAYLPFRAAQSPLMNWGNPVTPERFLWHLTGKQYRVWIFSSTEAAGRQLQYFLQSLPAEFLYAGLLPALVGAVVLWRWHRRLAAGLLLLFAGCVLYAINYDIHDIDSYFLLAYLTVALWAGVGLFAGARWLMQRMQWGVPAAAAAMALFAVVPLAGHFPRADQSGNFLVEDYALNMLRGVRPGALVFSFQWDYWVSASYYYQLVRGVRPDVAVVDKELLRRSWYFKELEGRYPWLVAGSRAEIDAFLRELHRFEHDLPYDPAVIQARFVEMITSMMQRNMASRPVYVTHEIEQEFTAGLQRVPEGLAYRLVADTLFHPCPMPQFSYRSLSRQGRLESNVPRIYSAALKARGGYYYRAGRVDEAKAAFLKALEFDAADGEVLRWLTLFGARPGG